MLPVVIYVCVCRSKSHTSWKPSTRFCLRRSQPARVSAWSRRFCSRLRIAAGTRVALIGNCAPGRSTCPLGAGGASAPWDFSAAQGSGCAQARPCSTRCSGLRTLTPTTSPQPLIPWPVLPSSPRSVTLQDVGLSVRLEGAQTAGHSLEMRVGVRAGPCLKLCRGRATSPPAPRCPRARARREQEHRGKSLLEVPAPARETVGAVLVSRGTELPPAPVSAPLRRARCHPGCNGSTAGLGLTYPGWAIPWNKRLGVEYCTRKTTRWKPATLRK